MPAVERATTAATTAARPAAPRANSYTAFAPTKVTLVRDGGSIIVSGNLNRSVVADVRLDGGLGSPTRGQFFAATHPWNSGAGAEKPMTKVELKQLKSSLTTFLASARLDQAAGKAYGTFMERLDAALKPAPAREPKVTRATAGRLLASFNKAAQGSLTYGKNLPLGVRYVEVPLTSEHHPDGFNYTALVPVGALSPSAKLSDPNKATQFIVKRTGGIAGLTMYSTPVSVR
jgi:hypothetical protein